MEKNDAGVGVKKRGVVVVMEGERTSSGERQVNAGGNDDAGGGEGREGVRTGQDKSRDGRETKTRTSLSDKTLAVFYFFSRTYGAYYHMYFSSLMIWNDLNCELAYCWVVSGWKLLKSDTLTNLCVKPASDDNTCCI